MSLPKTTKTRVARTLSIFAAIVAVSSLGYFLSVWIPIWRARAAATIIWDGGGDGTSWSDGLNWDTDVPPVPADDVLIDTSSTVLISEPITVNSIVIGVAGGTSASILEFTYDAISDWQ